MKRSAPRIDSSYRQYVSPLAKVRSDTSPTWMPSFSAIRCANSGCERPEKSMSRLDGPRSIQCSGLTSALVSATSSPGRRVSSVVALSTEIALFRDLLRRETSERFGRDIFCYVRTACNPSVVPDLHRCLEPIVNAGVDVPPDLRPSLGPVRLVGEVGSDVPGGDVRILPDLGIVGDYVRADLGAGGNSGLTAQHGERMDRRVGLELDIGIDPGRLRVHDGDACQHVFSVHARA